MRGPCIIGARRSAVVPRSGAFRDTEIHQLAAPVIRAALSSAGISPAQVDEVICANALGAGGNPARLVALAAGLPERIAGLTVDQQCCGGMSAVALAAAMIGAGLAEVIVAGGAESYSRRPIRMRRMADGQAEAYDQPAFTPWPERDPDMTRAAADLAERLQISRAEQEAYAMQSHAAACAAMPWMQETEIVPVAGVSKDSYARRLTPAHCARAPVLSGSVTAATTAVAADGAAFCVVVSARIAKAADRGAIEVIGGATIGGDPELPGLAPVAAIAQTLKTAGVSAHELAVAEIMEAYAVQAMACIAATGIPAEVVNPGGGALARGHPIGASGAINIVRLYNALLQRPAGIGIAAIAAAGGLGSALLLRR